VSLEYFEGQIVDTGHTKRRVLASCQHRLLLTSIPGVFACVPLLLP
jgi:hypothetical protein